MKANPHTIYKTNLRYFLDEVASEVYIIATERSLQDTIQYHINVTGYNLNSQLVKLMILTAEVHYPLTNMDHKLAKTANQGLLDEMINHIKAAGKNCIPGIISNEIVLGSVDDDLQPFIESLKKAV